MCTGYMLQIFIHRSIAESFAYPAEPYGIPISQSIEAYTMSSGRKADGQARIYFDPEVFLDPTRARLFHYCARPLQSCMVPSIAASRGALIKDLREALAPHWESGGGRMAVAARLEGT
mmetsp:Transcript_94662/g.294795  ORF Transcript_94662/g.294795 Transcript_94662/m.294795 type:complete len:118 (+) Transcript_94662:8-361(+)